MNKAKIETTYPKHLDWLNFLFLTLFPILTFFIAWNYIAEHGVQAWDVGAFLITYFLTGLAITAGYHRYYAHRAFECHWLVELYFLVFGAAALQNAILPWGSDHRYHHSFVDQPEDPYNAKKGFFWSHMGWIFFKQDASTRPYSNVSDLKRNRLVMWQYNYYWLIAVITTVALPLAIGWAYGNPWGGLVWGGFIRIVFVHHSTFLINSAAHYFGTRPYSAKHTARDNPWLAFLSYGEGYHNFHHTFASDYRNGRAWYDWDPTKWLIFAFSKVGLSWNLRRTPDELIAEVRSREALGLPELKDIQDSGNLEPMRALKPVT